MRIACLDDADIRRKCKIVNVHTVCALVLVLSDLLVLSARAVAFAIALCPLDHVADPATKTVAVLGIRLGHVLVAALDVRGVDVESGDRVVLRTASASDIKRGHRRAATFSAEERFGLRESFRSGHD